MAGRLKFAGFVRSWALALLVVPVLLAHLWLGEAVQGLQQGWSEVAAMPPRMTVSYVRELSQAPPARVQRASKPLPKPEPPPLAEPRIVPPAAVEPEPAASAPVETARVEPVSPAEPAASAVTLDATEPGPEWPPSTRLSYELTGNYRGAVTGNAQVEWIRKGRHYQVHLDVSIGPGFAPLISRRMSSDGLLGPAGIAPQRYDEDTRVLFTERRRVSVLFQGERLTLADGRSEPAPPGTQDAASQFVQLTWLFLTGREPLRVGHVVELPLALPKRQYLWRYEVLGEQELRTPMGLLATWHLKPSRTAGGGDLTAEVWLAPSLQYLPVRLRIHQDEATFIDLLLKAPPVQAEP